MKKLSILALSAVLLAVSCKEAKTDTVTTASEQAVAENTGDYPLRSRYQVESLYEDSRKTYIYNSDINNYDIVLVITDSLKENIKIDKLINAFAGCGRFILVKWR